MLNNDPNSTHEDTKTPFYELDPNAANMNSSVAPGSLYFGEAKRLWKVSDNGCDFHSAQVHIFAGLCAAQGADIQKSGPCLEYEMGMSLVSSVQVE
jgi:hypothetical protein